MQDWPAGDDDVGTAHSGFRGLGNLDVHLQQGRHVPCVPFRGIAADIIHFGKLEVWEDYFHRFEIAASLHAAGKDANLPGVFSCKILCGNRAGRAGSHGGDPGAVHDAQRKARFGIVQNQQPRTYGNPFSRFGKYRVTHLMPATLAEGTYPGIALIADSGIGWTSAFRRHLDPPAAFLAEHFLDGCDNLGS